MKLYLRNRFLQFNRPVIMGILNVTPDSFSDGGRYLNLDEALKHVEQMVTAGADIVDIGGESTRPGASTVSTDEEIDRIVPVIERVKREFEVLVSIDTYKERVARVVVEETHVDMVNDISGLRFSENMAATIARLEVPVIIMHIQGTPENMQKDPFYHDVVSELKQYFRERVDFALSQGIRKEKMIIDPGIGFGKRFEDNLEIIRRLDEFRELDCPILIGLSRKTFLGTISGERIPENREIESVAANMVSILNGASIIRVHNVDYTVRAAKVLQALIPMA